MQTITETALLNEICYLWKMANKSQCGEITNWNNVFQRLLGMSSILDAWENDSVISDLFFLQGIAIERGAIARNEQDDVPF